MKNKKNKKRIFSGIRATGRLHIGNYLGAIKGMLALQDNDDYEMQFAVVDVHAMTTPYDEKQLAKDTYEVVLDYLAAGLDPKKSLVLVQSRVADLHSELAMYFSTQMSIARMRHLPTFKEKVKMHPNSVTMALLNYPLLMAADILIYKSELVPVGVDQEPHLEVAREVARKMNSKYGTQFPEPKRFAAKTGYVPSLTGEGKMSKSTEGSYINLTDGFEVIKKKVAKIPTDDGTSQDGEKFEGPNFGILPFIKIFLSEAKVKEVQDLYIAEGKRVNYGELKDQLAEAIYEELKPLQKKRRELEKDPEYVKSVIDDGAKKAREMAEKTLKEVKEKMGLL